MEINADFFKADRSSLLGRLLKQSLYLHYLPFLITLKFYYSSVYGEFLYNKSIHKFYELE